MITNSGWESIPLPRTGGAPGRTACNFERRASLCQLVCEAGPYRSAKPRLDHGVIREVTQRVPASVARLRGTHDDPRLHTSEVDRLHTLQRPRIKIRLFAQG